MSGVDRDVCRVRPDIECLDMECQMTEGFEGMPAWTIDAMTRKEV